MLISIIIPAYNAERTIGRTLESLLCIPSARRSDVEIVCINDGSRDRTLALVQAFQEQHSEFGWTVRSQENEGLSRTRNTALGLASGAWLYFLDADDELATDLVALAEASPQASCIGCSVEYVRDNAARSGRPRRTAPVLVTPATHLLRFSEQNPFHPSSLLFKRGAVKQTFALDVDIVNDWLFWIDNPDIFEAMVVRPEIVSGRVHMHDSNMTRKYAELGLNRQKVATRILNSMNGRAGRTPQNNFRIQAAIGTLQQGAWCQARDFLRFPCSGRLHAYLWVYFAGRVLHLKPSRY